MVATVAVIPVSTYAKQTKFLQASQRIAGFVGGRGCGKSRVGSLNVLKRAKHGRFYMGVSDIYPRMEDSTIRDFLSLSRRTGRLLNYNKVEHRATFRTEDGGKADIRFRAAEDPEAMRGPNISGLWIDEASLVPEQAYLLAIAMCREEGEAGWIALTFTPKGARHWTYSTFFDEVGDPREESVLIHATSDENPFLPPGYADFLRKKYGTQLARQEVSGEFVEIGGLMFSRDWFQLVDRGPTDCERVCYWDKASTPGDGCYTCGVLMARDQLSCFYIEHVVRGQWSPDQRNKVMLSTAQMYAAKYGNTVRHAVEQEPGSGGAESALLTVRLLNQFPVTIDVVSGRAHRMRMRERLPGEAKVVRAQPFAAQAEYGNVRIVKSVWNTEYLDELCSFPESKYMDQVDASSGAYWYLAEGDVGKISPISATSHPPVQPHARGLPVHRILQGEGPGRYGLQFDGRR